MPKKNKYDQLFEELMSQFSRIPNFSESYKDPKGKSIHDFITTRMVEIGSFKALFLNYYLPAAAKSVVDDKREYEKSKYKGIINISTEDFKENLYETIRLGYIGMFHKYESFIDELIEKSELLIEGTHESSESLTEFTKKHFNYKIKDWRNSLTIHRINWICICNKHYDGYPRKSPKPSEFEHLHENDKIKLSKQDFKNDINLLLQHYKMTLTLVIMLAIYKMFFEDETFSNEEVGPDILESQKELKEKLEKMITAVKKC
ncbi:MAG: hypothetical protein WDZ35_00905 [Crocinitomicaceae bacterium]